MKMGYLNEKIPTGSHDLDRFLAGGYERDIISTVYGTGGSGKSNFVICACVEQVKKGNKVIFVDTEGSFSIERFFQVHQGRKEEALRSLSNVLLLSPTSFEEQEKAFENLLRWVKEKTISLIVIDSIAMLYRLELGDAIQTEEKEKIRKVNRKLAGQLRSLNEIARKEKIAVVVTNQVYSSFNNQSIDTGMLREVNMVGGDLLRYWSKCLIELKVSYGKRKALLRKHRSLAPDEISFEIVGSGIRKKGFF